MRNKGYKNLRVWAKADEFAFQIYQVTKNFPNEEKFGLTSQLRRAAISIAANLVEGSARHHKNETKQFANIALGSLAETEYLIEFCHRLGFVSEHDYQLLDQLRDELAKLLWAFYKSFD